MVKAGIRTIAVGASLIGALLLGTAAPQTKGKPQRKKEPWQYVTEKEPAHVVDGRMLEAFLVAKKEQIDGYRPPNKLRDYAVYFYDYGPYYGFGFVMKTPPPDDSVKAQSDGITYLVDKKTMKLAGSVAGG